MRIRAPFLCLWVSLLLAAASFCHGEEDLTVEVVGVGECADCAQSNIQTSQAFSGLRVTIDCKLTNGNFKTRGIGELDKQGKFTVTLPQELIENGKLKEECFAQLHSAASTPCPAHNGLDSSKLIFKSKTNKKHTFGLSGTLKFSPATCTSAFLWPYYKYPPLPPLAPLPPLTHHKLFPPYYPIPPKVFPPIYKKPLPPPVPVYKPPIPPPTPVVKEPIPPPVPVVKKPCPTKPPVSKPPPVPEPPVSKPPPIPKKPKKPKKPVYEPPPGPKVSPPPVPVYKKPLPPPIPIYKKPFPPKIPVYKPLPPPVPIYKPLPPIPKIPPFYKKPCPPLPPLPKTPPKYFHHHPKFGKYIPPLPPLSPHHP